MTLFRYVFLRFLAMFGRVLAIFAAILFTIGLVDELGALQGDQGIARAAYMSVMGQIETIYTVLPLVVIIAAISMFMGMSRSSEIVAVRAAGQSGLRFLWPPSLAALLIGSIAVALFNPLVTAMATQYGVEKGRISTTSVLYAQGSGLWLRQGAQSGQVMINAAAADQANLVLQGVNFIGFDANGAVIWRIEAAQAQLVPRAWVLNGAYRWDLTQPNPQKARTALADGAEIATDLQPKDVISGFGKPTSVPIWALAGHIAALEKAGFSARAYQVWLHSELAKPLSLVVMVLVAAGFTMRHIRAENRAQMVLYAVLIGFGIFFLRNIAQVFGQNGQVPVLLAAWGPTLATSLLAISLLLHLEEG